LGGTLTTTGRPVICMITADGTSTSSYLLCEGNPGDTVDFAIYRDATEIYRGTMTVPTTVNFVQIPCSLVTMDHLITGFPNTYTYQMQVKVTGSATVGVNFCRMIAYEL